MHEALSLNHTPGPWESIDSHVRTKFDGERGGFIIANCYSPSVPEYKANARLIAAAPDLLSAAIAVVDRWDSPNWKDAPHTGEFIHELRLAIEKATTVKANALLSGQRPEGQQ